MELSTLREATKDLAVSMGGGNSLAVSYYPGRYTRKMQKDIDAKDRAAEKELVAWEAAAKKAKEAEEDAPERPNTDDVQGVAEMVVGLLASWDLTDSGKPVPICVDSCVDALGYIYTLAILRAILSDITVGGSSTGPNK